MKLFETEKRESPISKIKRWGFNVFPAYRGTGALVCFLSCDWKEIHIKLSLKWSTKNYVGSVFGGSLYGALDPIYMVQLINIFRGKYVVWDKSATIRFLRPVKKTVKARFLITDDLIGTIEREIEQKKETIIDLPVEFLDDSNKAYVRVTKQIYIADKKYYQAKGQQRKTASTIS